jgi:hypothetical protein
MVQPDSLNVGYKTGEVFHNAAKIAESANFWLCFDGFHQLAYTEKTDLCVLHLQKRNHRKASEASSTPRKNYSVNTTSPMTRRAM